MKFTCEKTQLVSAISVASRTVAQKSARIKRCSFFIASPPRSLFGIVFSFTNLEYCIKKAKTIHLKVS